MHTSDAKLHIKSDKTKKNCVKFMGMLIFSVGRLPTITGRLPTITGRLPTITGRFPIASHLLYIVGNHTLLPTPLAPLTPKDMDTDELLSIEPRYA